MNATELFDGLAAIEGSREAGSQTNGFDSSRLVNGVEYGLVRAVDERKLRAAWKRRTGGGATPLVLIADDPEDPGKLRVLGPRGDGLVHRVRTESMLELVTRSASLNRLEAVRQVAQEVERLDTEGVAGLAVRGLGTEYLYGRRLPASDRWPHLTRHAQGLPRGSWRDVLAALGYELTELPRRGYLARAEGRPALVVHPQRSADRFARLDSDGRLPEGALLAACTEHNVRYGMLAAGTRMRLLRAADDEGGAATSYLELDAAALEPEQRPLLGLLSPQYLVEGGFDSLMVDARDHGAALRRRLDRSLREHVLPVLGRELGRWAEAEGLDLTDDGVREDLEAAALTWVFRALFLLYAESAGYLPMGNETYRQRSLTRIAERAAAELDSADPRAPTLWRDVQALVDAMRTGQTAWGVPPYNGALFAEDGFAGASTLERARVPDAALARALVALARDPEDPGVGADFSGLEVGHLGHIYEGLLSLRLSVADRDYSYDAKADRYRPAGDAAAPEVRAGELLWLTNEGGRKGGGVYYTRSELVRHLVRESVRPAFERHLEEVRRLAETDPARAAQKLFDFAVLDPACGSAHFLVEVVDELADRIATLLGELSLPAVREALDSLKAAAGRTFGAGMEDTALLKRLVLKRCIYGVDLSPMGAEIAKVSLWLGSFVPGLSLAYLDHNVQTGNSLMGVARPEAVLEPEAGGGQIPLFADSLGIALREAAGAAARLRSIEDRTPDEVEASREADRQLHVSVAGAERVLDLWTAEGLGLEGARDEALEHGRDVVEGGESRLADRAGELAREHRVLHWPLAFAEVFARERPGFDVVVGNPPWEEVTVEEQSFYALFRPGIRRGISDAARAQAVEELLAERPELSERLASAQDEALRLRKYFAAEYEGGTGDPDIYKLFCQRYRELVHAGGALGVVLPRNVFMAKGSARFRSWLFDHAPPSRIDFLVNRRRWAFDIHPQSSVALLLAVRGSAYEEAEFEVAGVADSAEAFRRQTEAPGRLLRRRALGPRLEIPLLRSQAAGDLLAKLRSGVAFPHGCKRWRCFPVAEFHETNDGGLWEGATVGRPLWKGASFDQFDPHGAEARVCPASEAALSKARKPRPGGDSLLASEVPLAIRRQAVERTLSRARIAFKDVTQRTNSRTVLGCLIPPEHFLTNSAPYLAFLDSTPRASAACLALMNSLAFDWQARRFVETHVNFFILEGLRLPSVSDAAFDALAASGARLSCPDERFAEFASEAGVEHGPLDPAERERLRAECDAWAAHAYGLDADELELVFSDFTESAVPPDYRDAVRARLSELA